MSESISHRGTIVSIEGGTASVEIISQSACSTCHAAGLCSASESAVKMVEVKVHSWENYHEGQQVDVFLAKSMGLKAVLISYVIPVLILMILILFLSFVTDSELLAGLCGLGGTALYYLVLYFFRGSLSGRYEFTMSPRIQD